jgi:heme exporter protein D
MCGYTCSILIPDLATAYIWAFVFVPTVMTIISCVLLPIRFVIQKRQLQRVQWHRARKMILQTTGIASVYTICWLPYTIILQLVENNLLSFSNPNLDRFFAIAPYMTSLLTPFIVFHTVRSQMNLGIMERIKRRFFPRRQEVVQPVISFIGQQQNPSARDNHTSTRQLKIIKNTYSHPLKPQ